MQLIKLQHTNLTFDQIKKKNNENGQIKRCKLCNWSNYTIDQIKIINLIKWDNNLINCRKVPKTGVMVK